MTPQEAFDIARKLGQRDPSLEQAICRCPEYACQYARHILKGRWPEAEEIIASNSVTAYKYGRYVLRGHWDLDILWRCPEWLYEYVQDVCGGVMSEDARNVFVIADLAWDDHTNGWYREQLKRLLTPPRP